MKALVRRSDPLYQTEKIEAYNVAIEALRMHEPADGDPTGIAYRLRKALADRLDREIQRWVNSLPSNVPPHAFRGRGVVAALPLPQPP